MYDEKLMLKKTADQFRYGAIVSITLGTFVTLSCVLMVPIFCNYIQTIHSALQTELNFCRQRTGNIWNELIVTKVKKNFFLSKQNTSFFSFFALSFLVKNFLFLITIAY